MTESRNWKLPFFTIWTGQAVSLLGSQLVQFALVWWLTKTTNSATVLATATTVGLLPTILLGPFAGTLVDRWPRKWVLILSDGSTAFFTALLSLLFWLDIAQPWHVFLILFLRSLGDAFQNPAMHATTPLMVPKDQLTRVASMNSTLQGILRFVAPPLGALLLELIDVRGILPLDVITALLAVFSLVLIAVPSPTTTARVRGPAGVLRGLGEGLRYIWDWRQLRWFVATSALWSFGFYPLNAFRPLLITQHFGGGVQELSWVQAASGVGFIAGGMLLAGWGGFKRRLATSITGTYTIALCSLFTGLAPASAFPLVIVAAGLSGIAQAFHSSGASSANQAIVAPEMQGRYFSVSRSILSAMAPLALAVAGPVADVVGVQPFWLVTAVVAFLIASIRRLNHGIYHIEDAPGPSAVAPIVLGGGAGAGQPAPAVVPRDEVSGEGSCNPRVEGTGR